MEQGVVPLAEPVPVTLRVPQWVAERVLGMPPRQVLALALASWTQLAAVQEQDLLSPGLGLKAALARPLAERGLPSA